MMLGSLLQPAHFVILLFIAAFLFAGKLFASLGKGFGDAVRNYKRAIQSSDKHDDRDG
jgi:Sec-independent protein translocase protein TatA